MPELKEAEVQKFDLDKVESEMDSRMKEVDRIVDGVESWDQIPEDREGRDRLPKMMQELNLLGGRRDLLVEAEGNQKAYTALKDVLTEPEKFLATSKKKEGEGDFASQFMESEYGQKAKAGFRGGETEFPLKAVGLKATLGEDATQTNIDTDFPVRADRLGGTIDELFQMPNIADLIPVTTTGVDSIDHVTETYTDAAAETDEGDAAPEATLDFTLVSEPVRKIPVGIKASSEVLGDVGLMRGLVQLRIRQDVARREDEQLLLGDGVAPNLEGILNRSGIGNANSSLTGNAGLNFLDALFSAGTVVRQAFQSPSAVVMNALGLETIWLAKDQNDQYLMGRPNDAVVPRVWGQRIVTNENMADPDTSTNVAALMGDWAGSALIARNPNVAVGVTDSDASDFLADILTFKVSIREALLVTRPGGFSTVTITA